MLGLRHLRAFVATAEELLSRTGRKRHLTRQALSLQLRKLEQHLGGWCFSFRTSHLELSGRFAEFRGMEARYRTAVEDLVTEGAATSEFSLPPSLRTVVRTLVGMLDCMQHWSIRGEQDDLRLADGLFASGLGGLAAGGSLRRMPQSFQDMISPAEPVS
jgi:hypothetical protein